MTMQERTDGADAPPPSQASGPGGKNKSSWKKATAILAFLAALLGLTSAILGLVARHASQQNQTLTINLEQANSAKVSAEQSVSAAQSTISSLQSQLAAPTESPSGSQPPTNRNSGIVTIAASNTSGFDFDGMGKTWQEPSGYQDASYDASTGLYLQNGATAVIIPTQATYDSCQTTGYGRPEISLKANLPRGTNICLRTNEHRYVALKLLAITADSIQFDAASYDPPDPNAS